MNPRSLKQKRRTRVLSGAAAAVTATALVVGLAQSANAAPQIPGVSDLLNALNPNQGESQDGGEPQAPAPALPELPQLPDVQLPELPPLPENPEDLINQIAPGSADALPDEQDIQNLLDQLPPELRGQDLQFPEIPGLDFDPPAPIPGMITPSGHTFTVMSDSTALLGNVKLSYVTLDTAQGPKPAIRIDADKVVLDNLNVRFPGAPAGLEDVWQRTGPGQITTLDGNFHIIVSKLTVTPQIAGITMPFALPIEASMAPEELGEKLKLVGAGLPDAISEQTVMLNGEMDTYYISADDLVGGQGTTIGP